MSNGSIKCAYMFIHNILQVYLEKTWISSQTVYHQGEYIYRVWIRDGRGRSTGGAGFRSPCKFANHLLGLCGCSIRKHSNAYSNSKYSHNLTNTTHPPLPTTYSCRVYIKPEHNNIIKEINKSVVLTHTAGHLHVNSRFNTCSTCTVGSPPPPPFLFY